MQKILLIVDDEPQLLTILSKVFIKNNYKVFTASNGDEALKILATTPVHIILSDYRMPKMTGSELLKKVKELYPQTNRLIMSAYADFDIIKDSINEGSIYKFISKPFDNDSIVQIVSEALELNASQNESKYISVNGQLISDADLLSALDQNQFEVYYQPVIHTVTQKIAGFEALLRWQHPEYGLLLPETFISLCETSKLIIPIGLWVMRTACLQLKQWQIDGYNELTMAVNISTCQFNHPGLFDVIENILSEAEISSKNLELEITESVIMENREENILRLNNLRNLGLKLSLDDFGTGYSSLTYLSEFPLNTLKIDKSFVHDITTKPNILEIVAMTIELAKKLNLITIAEGVETQEQFEILKEKKCDFIQGYLFSRPVPKEKISQLLAEQKS